MDPGHPNLKPQLRYFLRRMSERVIDLTKESGEPEKIIATDWVSSSEEDTDETTDSSDSSSDDSSSSDDTDEESGEESSAEETKEDA